MDIIKSPKIYNVPNNYIPCYQNVLRAFDNPLDLSDQTFPYFNRPFQLRSQDDKAAWFMTELARVQPPQDTTEVKLLQYIHCRLIYQMKGARRQMPRAVHVAFSMSPAQNRPEKVILATTVDLLSVFGSSIPARGPESELKNARQLQNFTEIIDYFPNFRLPSGAVHALEGANPKMGHCCEDKPWKALAGYVVSEAPIPFLTKCSLALGGLSLTDRASKTPTPRVAPTRSRTLTMQPKSHVQPQRCN
ncbi:MAG: hypothetical protein Q9192_007455 [Flavoplaca navasiana]